MKLCPVSVILPFHNCEDTLVRSVRSVMDQTYPPAQVVLINDGSTDKSLERLDEFLKARADKDRVTLVHLEKNLGVYVARNRGLDAATQSYLAFQDADDFWHPKKLEIQMGVMENDPSLYLTCHKVDVWPTDKPIVWPDRRFKPERLVPVHPQVALWVTQLHTISIIMKNTPKYRFDEKMWRGGDMLMWLEVVLSNEKSKRIRQTLSWKAKAHVGAAGLSGNLWKAEKANQYTIRALARKGLISWPYAMLLSVWCYIKLIRRFIVVGFRKAWLALTHKPERLQATEFQSEA